MPLSNDSLPETVDYLVIGGGSGGVASARRAASYGKSVLIVEAAKWGGTCVNVGCVPKKVFWHAADIAHKLKDASSYCFGMPKELPTLDWAAFKKKRDAYIVRLNGIYEKNLKQEKVMAVQGKATLVGQNEVEIALDDGSKARVQAQHILIATGGEPIIPTDIEGASLGISSDGFFKLEKKPRKVAIIGAGYIAVEFAGVFNSLETETHLFIRHGSFLRSFDKMIQEKLAKAYEDQGIHLHKNTVIKSLTASGPEKSQKTIEFEHGNGEMVSLDGFDDVIWAVGRKPSTAGLGLQGSDYNIGTDERGRITVDKWQKTTVDNVHALGDVCNRGFELTPVAIAAGRRLSDHLFKGEDASNSYLDYQNVPSVVFSHPTIGSIGLTEADAVKEHGNENVHVYVSHFVAMSNSMLDPQDKQGSTYKLVTLGSERKVIGLHIIGEGSDEILQGFAVAIKMGATKADFDNCVAIHPTSAEELVTIKESQLQKSNPLKET